MKHTTLSRFASLAASAALALSLAACGSTSRSTYSAAVSNDTAALSSQDAGDYESYSAESAAAGEGSSFSSDDLTSSMLDPSTVEAAARSCITPACGWKPPTMIPPAPPCRRP